MNLGSGRRPQRKFKPCQSPHPPTNPTTASTTTFLKHHDVKETQRYTLGSFLSLSAAIRLSYMSLIASDRSSEGRSSSGGAANSHLTQLENSLLLLTLSALFLLILRLCNTFRANEAYKDLAVSFQAGCNGAIQWLL